MDQQQIGFFLKSLRENKKLTQEELAELLGVSGRTVSRWENGRNIPDLSVLVQLSDFYGVHLNEIVNGKRESEETNMDEKEKKAVIQLGRAYREEKYHFPKTLNYLLALGCFGVLGYFVTVNSEWSNLCIGLMAGALVTAFLINCGYLIFDKKMACPDVRIGEKVMPSTYKDNWSGVGGYVTLREDGFSFAAHDLNFRKEELSFFFEEIDDLTYGKTLGMTNLIVAKKEGKEYQFLMGKKDREEVMAAYDKYKKG